MTEVSRVSDPAQGTMGVSLVAELNVLLRRPRLVLGVAFAGAIVGAAVTKLAGPTYEAESRFMPQVKELDASRLAGLAAQFGVNIGAGQDPTQSVEFYAELLESPDLLKQLAQTEFRFAVEAEQGDTLSGTLIELYEVKGRTESDRLKAAVADLEENVRASTGLRRAGIVTLTTEAAWAELAELVNRRVLELVSEFNLERRQSQAAAERRFVGERLEVMQQELEAREAELAQFLEQNRLYEQSPTLTFEAERLRRRVSQAQQVVTGLAQSFEESRIQEVRNTPVITILDTPEGSAQQQGSLILNTLLGGFMGSITAVVFAFLAQFIERDRRQHPDVYEEFHQLSRGALHRLLPSVLVSRSPADSGTSRGVRGDEPDPTPITTSRRSSTRET